MRRFTCLLERLGATWGRVYPLFNLLPGRRKRTWSVKRDSGRRDAYPTVSGLRRLYTIPWRILAARTVLCISIAIVIGPTPPGTGVIREALAETASKSTSPTSR